MKEAPPCDHDASVGLAVNDDSAPQVCTGCGNWNCMIVHGHECVTVHVRSPGISDLKKAGRLVITANAGG